VARITGHTPMREHAPGALRRFDFDTVMLPLNFVLWFDPASNRRDFEALWRNAPAGIGVHVIKTLAKAPGASARSVCVLVRAVRPQGDIDQSVASTCRCRSRRCAAPATW